MPVANTYGIEYPENFDEYAWEAGAKGWLPGVVALINGRRYKLTFYDPARLSQDIEGELQQNSVFFEPNLLIVPSVTRAHMEAAVAAIARTGGQVALIAEDP
jgi:hypothetical protein